MEIVCYQRFEKRDYLYELRPIATSKILYAQGSSVVLVSKGGFFNFDNRPQMIEEAQSVFAGTAKPIADNRSYAISEVIKFEYDSQKFDELVANLRERSKLESEINLSFNQLLKEGKNALIDKLRLQK